MTHLSKQTIIDETQHIDAPSLARDIPVVEITLRFRSEKEKSDWLGQLLDGYGEGWCDVHWDWQHGVQCDDAKVFDVELLEVEDDDDED